jgi:hypothetical protein
MTYRHRHTSCWQCLSSRDDWRIRFDPQYDCFVIEELIEYFDRSVWEAKYSFTPEILWQAKTDEFKITGLGVDAVLWVDRSYELSGNQPMSLYLQVGKIDRSFPHPKAPPHFVGVDIGLGEIVRDRWDPKRIDFSGLNVSPELRWLNERIESVCAKARS